MNELNKAELRRLAEECGKHGENWYDSRNMAAFPEFQEDQDFVIAANPSTVLALLDELEAAQLGMKYSHAIRIKKTIEDLESERDAALAELEAYRKDAERYQRLRGASVRDHGIAPDKFDAEFDAGLKAIDVAMGYAKENGDD